MWIADGQTANFTWPGDGRFPCPCHRNETPKYSCLQQPNLGWVTFSAHRIDMEAWRLLWRFGHASCYCSFSKYIFNNGRTTAGTIFQTFGGWLVIAWQQRSGFHLSVQIKEILAFRSLLVNTKLSVFLWNAVSLGNFLSRVRPALGLKPQSPEWKVVNKPLCHPQVWTTVQKCRLVRCSALY